MLEIKHITSAYHKDFPILSDINMVIGDHEKVVLLGRNGAGKTTFANTIFGLTPIISGEIVFNGFDILSCSIEKLHSLRLGYFMQGAPVFPQMSVKENLKIAAGKAGSADFTLRYNELKAHFPILKNDRVDRSPAGSLSGGERTQLCIAMAVFGKPELLILDEPFAGLSPANAGLILEILNEYQESANASIILIAQDKQMATGFSKEHYIIRDSRINKEFRG